MKRLIPVIALLLGWASAAGAAPPGALTTLRAIRALSNSEAKQSLPVAFEATVTYCDNNGVDLFVQEGNDAIYVEVKANSNLFPGDRVLVRGTTRGSFNTDILGDKITLLHHGVMPVPLTVSFEELIRAELDCKRVAVRAKVRSADTVQYGTLANSTSRFFYLRLLLDGGYIDAIALDGSTSDMKGLLDADVEVTGVVSGMFDSKMQLTGILLQLTSLKDIKVLKRATISPESLPVTPMDKVLSAYHVQDLTHRVRVQGVITYYQPGTALVLQDGPRSLWISTHASDSLQIGDLAEVTGFPDARYSFLALTEGEIHDLHIPAPVQPQSATWSQLASWNSGNPDGHQNDLVSIDGRVVTGVREASQDEFILSADGKLFTAIYRHPPTNEALPPIEKIPLGAMVRVTGICMTVQANTINPNEVEVPFNILLRSFDDIAVIARPSLLSIRNLMLSVGLLFVILLLAAAKGWSLERKVRRQTVIMAARTEAEVAMERRRSNILEEINGTAPLAGMLEQIAEMVSFRLNSAPCWCEISAGARLGEYPPNVNEMRVLQEEIPARAGPALGMLLAAFDAATQPDSAEKEALLVGARLATLAIETRRLNSDLRHRSEFDLLTDIHNRFSMEKRLSAQIEAARQDAAIFGLIYIDLDGFKQVNDLYGHHIGDLYLQEVARRMKQQLRAHDLLARLGGDEFAVLVSMVQHRTGVEEIAQRLEHCFDNPLVLADHALTGAASFGIAVYPEDGATTDSLLNAADAAMYAVKRSRKQAARVPARQEEAVHAA